LGWIGKDVLRKELNEIAFSLKAGQYSHVIETAEGYYILQVEDVKPAHTVALAEVRDDIEKILLQQQRAKMQEDWSRTSVPKPTSIFSKQIPNRPRIGITLGDPAGIGPEVVAKALKSGRLNRCFDYEIIGNHAQNVVPTLRIGLSRVRNAASLVISPRSQPRRSPRSFCIAPAIRSPARQNFWLTLAHQAIRHDARGWALTSGARNHACAAARRRETHYHAQNRRSDRTDKPDLSTFGIRRPRIAVAGLNRTPAKVVCWVMKSGVSSGRR